MHERAIHARPDRFSASSIVLVQSLQSAIFESGGGESSRADLFDLFLGSPSSHGEARETECEQGGCGGFGNRHDVECIGQGFVREERALEGQVIDL